MAAAPLLCLAGGVAADELAYDPDVLPACLKTAEPAESCIGQAAAACTRAEDAVHYGPVVALCSNAERVQWQGLMDAAYDRLADEAVELDEIAAAQNYAMPGALLLAQRESWIAFRAATLEYETARWLGGSGEGPEVARRDLHLTAAHALSLIRAMGDVKVGWSFE